MPYSTFDHLGSKIWGHTWSARAQDFVNDAGVDERRIAWRALDASRIVVHCKFSKLRVAPKKTNVKNPRSRMQGRQVGALDRVPYEHDITTTYSWSTELRPGPESDRIIKGRMWTCPAMSLGVTRLHIPAQLGNLEVSAWRTRSLRFGQMKFLVYGILCPRSLRSEARRLLTLSAGVERRDTYITYLGRRWVQPCTIVAIEAIVFLCFADRPPQGRAPYIVTRQAKYDEHVATPSAKLDVYDETPGSRNLVIAALGLIDNDIMGKKPDIAKESWQVLKDGIKGSV
ncbi:hypothetical protein BD779DRAFT_1790164 [Infundibulicybe gibba]|nr:hypothetical protein BD779DRAFT_1790164 [Infundibulicybe gibba]